MYIVKYGNQYIHDPFSDTQRAYDVHISSDINASGTCEFTIGPSHPLYNKLELRSSSNNVTVLEDDTVLFDGYIYSFSTNYDKSRDVTCYGCLSYFGDIRLRPYATQQSDDDPPDMVYCSSTIDGLFEFYIDQYNKYAEEGRKFHMGTNEGSVIRELNSISASSDSYPTVADELSEKLLDTVGGYVFIHHDGTERYIDYFANCTDVNAQIVDFGVNIIDFVKTDTMSGFYTALRPVGGTPSESEDDKAEKETENPKRFPISLNLINDGPTDVTGIVKKGDVVYNEDAVTKYGYVEGYQSYSEITDVAALEHQAAIDIKIASSIHPTIEVKAIDLALYKQGNEPLVPGQLVRVRSIPHGLDEYLLLNNMDIDISDPSNTVYTFGEAIDSLTGEQNKKAAELNASINHSLDSVAELDQTIKDQAIQIGNVENVANNAQNTANNAQNTANSNKEAIDSIKDAQTEYEKQLEQMQAGVEQAEKEIDGINDRLDQMDTEAGEVQASIDAVRQEAQTNFETAKNAADAAGQRADAAQEAVDSLRESTSSELQNVKDSVSGVRSDVDAVEQKAADLASELDGTKATVEQVTTDLGEVKTTVSNAATKADQALQVSTSASQTATEAKTTATSAYQDAQSALTQSSTASQTANAVKTELETKYSTTDEIAEQYATKSLVEQTSQSITSTVEATYATKATVEALENIANNAVQTWMGSGVPTLSNKPASDWTTAELKSQHSGDIYYDTNTGYSYRFGSSDGKNYSWSLIKDTDISKAVADAAKAQQTAEGVSDEVTQLKTDIPATYATKTEVKQTTDSIKSSVSEVATTANSALSKATTVEQTAKGLQTTVTEQAEKLDGAVTTISQVSQKVDSVSSTITQVSGRVDDVEDKADAAQGTANSALSQASRVEQSLDSFKTSVSRDYQTKTDALSQKSELEQNINSFKTTVSETYTTKDEFNALEIGGTNLIKGSKPYGKSGFFEHFNSVTDNEYGELTLQSTTTSQSFPSVFLDYSDTFTFDKTDIVTGDKYVISYDVMMLERTYTTSSTFTESWIGIRHNGGNWSGLIKYDGIKDDFLNAPLNEWAHFEHSITANAWDGTTHIGANIQLGTRSVGKFRFRMRNVKLEKGSKATAWSPAPEDFDGKYTSKTEFKQTTDKISATATAASQNASSALSKISSLEVSVDGIDAKVEEVASDADEAVKTASQVSQRVDSLSSTITQVQGDVKTAKDTANSALSKSSSVEQNLNSFKTSVSQTYETKSDASNKQSSLQQSVNNLRTEVSETYTTKKEFNNLSIGGTNRALLTATAKTITGNGGTNQTSRLYALADNAYTLFGTGKVTISYDVTISGSTAGKFHLQGDGDPNWASWGGSYNLADIGTGTHHLEDTVNFTSSDNTGSIAIRLDKVTGTVKISNLKVEKGTKATDWSPAPEDMLSNAEAAQTYSTKSYVDQTSRTASLGVVEEYKNGQHGSALATQSDITATKDSITSTVSQTYLSKTDATNTYLNKNTAASTYATKTEVKQTSDSLTVTISSAMSKAESAATAASNAQNTANAAAGSSTNYIKNGGPNGTSNPIAGWTVSGNVYKHTFPGGQNHVDLGFTTLAHPIVVGRTYRLSLDARVTSGTFSSSDYFNFGLSNGWEDIKAQALTGSWKTYSGVVTSSKEATLVFMSSYVGSSGSKVVEMRNVSMTDVTETYNAATDAQSTANTANSNAQNAQNRVGNLETCIKMTSDGVRVGKISNGNFTGYSALVNSEGSFDILDSGSNPVTSFQHNKVQFYSNGSKFGEMDLVNETLQFGIRTKADDQAWASTLTMQPSYLGLLSEYGPINMVARSGIQIVGQAGPVEINGNSIVLRGPTTFNGNATVSSGNYLSIANNATLRFAHSQVKDIIHGSTVIIGNGTSHRQILSSSQVNFYGGYREGDFFQAWNGDYSANSSTIKGTSYHNGAFYVDFDTNMQGSYRVNWTWIKFSN